MLWLLKLMFFGKWCEHKWVTVESGRLGDLSGLFTGHYKNCHCEKCGAWKVFNLR